MFLRVSSNGIKSKDIFMIECDNQKRPIDKFSKTISFDCGNQVNCHVNIEFIPGNLKMGFVDWVVFVLKEIVTSILFFLVFDKGAWYENIDPFRIKKKVTFKPSSQSSGEMSFEFQNSLFDKKEGRYAFPKIIINANGVVISEEVGYLPNLGSVRLGFIHYIFQIVIPSVILLALCAYGLVYSILSSVYVLVGILSLCSVLILGFLIVMLYRGSKMRVCVENAILSQLGHLQE